ncbi:MAG: hypothetical protein Q4G27_01695 [Flavobacteriaceae bacterium]|nr:hypothetical protein [Flavobacteriaceae bacterium]
MISFSCLFVSCDFIKQAYEETFSEESQSSELENKSIDIYSDFFETDQLEGNLLSDAVQLAQTQAKLENMFPGKTLKVYPPHIFFERDRIRLKLVNPSNESEVDWYIYKYKNAKWEKESPVKISAYDKENHKPVPINEMDLGIINKVYIQLLEKSKNIEGAKPITSVIFSFYRPEWEWTASIVGSRADYDFTADRYGNEISFEHK